MAVRWTKAVSDGLGHIYALASTELENHELSEMECTCAGCNPSRRPEGEGWESRPCECDAKPLAGQCEGCRTTHEWAAALSWLGHQIDKHRT